MKKAILPLLALFSWFSAFSQVMVVKRHNYTFFSTDVKKVPPLLDRRSTPDDKKHPEYGIVPFNSYCSNCAELIDKRTVDSRYFISPDTEAKFFIEKSYFPLHYKKSNDDIWRTIDFRLKPTTGQPGVYQATDQAAPTKCDLNRKSTSFVLPKSEFEFNHDLTLYFFDDTKAYLKAEKGDYSHYSIGDEGLVVKNMWPGIDMEQTFRTGEIETDYVINKPLTLPIDSGYMVIEDHFSLPEGWTVKESETGTNLENGYFSGDYMIGDGKGTEIVYHRPAYFDAVAMGMLGMYNLKNEGNDYTLQMMVPVQWLNLSSNTYPIYIDPWVSPDSTGTDQVLGNYASSMQPYFQYAFTDQHLGSCNDTLYVPIPGGTTLVEAYTAIEYQLTYSHSCGVPAVPFCTFSQVTQQVVNNKCGTTSGPFQCNPAAPPFTGTCTTDSVLVAGAHPLRINNFNANYMSCLVPQCTLDTLSFTLENQDSTCGDVCDYLCARGHLFSMIIVGYNLYGSMAAVGYPAGTTNVTVCQGQTVNFTALGQYAVPPYTFLWTKDGGSTYDTTYVGAYSVLATDTNGYSIACDVVDTCGVLVHAGVFTITVLTAPPASAGQDKFVCEVEGGTVTIGGNPVTPAQDSIIGWSAENATALSWLSDTTSANPTVTVPPGTADTVFYVVTTTNNFCTSTDTVLVYSISNPVVTIDSAGPTAFCPGQHVQLIALATGGVTNYVWSNGDAGVADTVITVYTPGSYNVTVSTPGGCKDTSNSITVTNIGPPAFHIFPDTTIQLGDSVALFADIHLLTAAIDSFTWSPLLNLSCATCVSPYAAPVAPQEYYLTVYRGGCFVSDSLLIQVILPTNFYIPNAFTPGHPGENDQFYIYCQEGVKVLSFQIFDRIGEKVHDGTYPWDGTYKGKPAPEGVYVYTFSLSLFGELNSVFRKGSVTLIR